jgi:hypothetical protein
VPYDFGEQDAAINTQRRRGKWQFSSTGRLSLLNFKLAPLRLAKNGKPSFSSPKIHRQNFPIETVVEPQNEKVRELPLAMLTKYNAKDA